MQGTYGSNFNNSHDTYQRTILYYYLQIAVKCCKLEYIGHKTKGSYTECLKGTYTYLNKEYIFNTFINMKYLAGNTAVREKL
jgi:hypothetical protein